MKLIKIICIVFISAIIVSCDSPKMAIKSNYAVMNVFFATDRKQNKSADIKARFGEERGELKYGVTKVQK